MRLKTYFKLFLLVTALYVTNTQNAFSYSGGNGTDTPYEIANSADLQELSTTIADWGLDFILTSDIDMNGQTFNPIGKDADNKFTGSIDGQNHVISNLSITPHGTAPESFQGLIGYGRNCIIKNLGLLNITNETAYVGDNSDKPNVGAFAGKLEYGSSLLENCFVIGGTVKGRAKVGGLVGELRHGTIHDCFVSLDEIVGYYDTAIGGITGTIDASAIVDRVTVYDATFYKRIATSALGDAIAGDIGTATITNAFISSSITALLDNGGASLSIQELKVSDNYTTLDFATPIWEMKTNSYAVLSSFPSSVYNSLPLPMFSGGSGTSENPYLISTADDVVMMSDSGVVLNNTYLTFEITNDIDMSGKTFHPIPGGSTKFTIEGENQIISNLTITPATAGEANIGLIQKGANAQINNLGLVNITVDAAGSEYVGAFIGNTRWGNGLTNCYVLGGTIKGKSNVGSLMGYVEDAVLFTNCFSSAKIELDNNESGTVGGGLIGYIKNDGSDPTLSNVAFYGTINHGSGTINGLVGQDAGDATAYTNAYFVNDESLSDANGSGLSTTALRSSSSYTGFTFDASNWTMTTDGFAVLSTFPSSASEVTLTPTVLDGWSNGTITPATAQSVGLGVATTFTFTPNTDYGATNLWINGTQTEYWSSPATSYTFVAPTSNSNLDVMFQSTIITADKKLKAKNDILISNNELFIQSEMDNNYVNIYDLSGRNISNFNFSSTQFTTDLQLNNGIYIIRLNNTFTKKILVK